MEITHYLYLALPPRPSFVTDATPEEGAVMERHFAYLAELQAAGKLLLAGPALDGAFGVAILKVSEAGEAEALVRGDPAVESGLFSPRLHALSLGAVTP